MPGGHALVAAMRWAGSLFLRTTSQAARDSLFTKAHDLTTDVVTPRSGYLAQAMLVLVIAMDGMCNRTASAELLAKLEGLAVEIGLHRRDFATQHSTEAIGLAVSAESWRRTWWELYVVDALVAGVHRRTSFPLYYVESDVALPCEEDEYLRGDIPTPSRLLSELQDEAFSDDDDEFSSFAYRILCANAMGQFIQRQPISRHDSEAVRRVEATLTNWKLHLPEHKHEALQRSGKHDEMMFQALMMHHAMSIMLHQPLSQLDTSVAEPIDSCASPEHMRPQTQTLMLTPSTFSAADTHAVRTIAAATAISDLVTHREAMLRHSHFFACVVTLSSIVHFSHWALATEFFAKPADGEHGSSDIRQSIKLNIGALRALAHVWPAASTACLQVQSVAREIRNMRNRTLPTSQLPGDSIEMNLAQALAVDDALWQMWNSLG